MGYPMAFRSFKYIKYGIIILSIITLRGFHLTLYEFVDVIPLNKNNDLRLQENVQKYDCDLNTAWNAPSEIDANYTNISPLFVRLIDGKYAIFCSSAYKPEGTGNALS